MCAIIGRPNQSTRVLHINITSLYPKDIFMRRQSVCHHVKADPSPLRRASVYIIVLYWTMPELKSDRFLFLAPQNVDCNVLPRKKMILASVSFFFSELTCRYILSFTKIVTLPGMNAILSRLSWQSLTSSSTVMIGVLAFMLSWFLQRCMFANFSRDFSRLFRPFFLQQLLNMVSSLLKDAFFDWIITTANM